MLNQKITGSFSGNTFSGCYWLVEEGISHGWDRVVKGKVHVFLFRYRKVEHHGVLFWYLGITVDWCEPPVKPVRCFGLPKLCEFIKGLDNHIKWGSLGIVLIPWMLHLPQFRCYRAWAVCLCMNWVPQHNHQMSKDHGITSTTTDVNRSGKLVPGHLGLLNLWIPIAA